MSGAASYPWAIMVKRLFLLLLALPALSLGNPSLPTKSGADQWRARIRDAALRVALDPKLVEAVVSVESGFKEKIVSNKGAAGLMQVMEITARECGIHNRFHAMENLIGACQCLRKLVNRYRGDIKLALAAYNAGPKNVSRAGGIPNFPETIAYVDKVLKKYTELQAKP